jgi:hypothetical protein
MLTTNNSFFEPHHSVGVRNGDVMWLLWGRNIFLNSVRLVLGLKVLSCVTNDSWPFIVKSAISCLSPILHEPKGNSVLFTHAIAYLFRKLLLVCLIIPTMWWWVNVGERWPCNVVYSELFYYLLVCKMWFVRTFKVQWLFSVQPDLTLRNSIFCPQSVFLCFSMVFRTSSNYFAVQW